MDHFYFYYFHQPMLAKRQHLRKANCDNDRLPWKTQMLRCRAPSSISLSPGTNATLQGKPCNAAAGQPHLCNSFIPPPLPAPLPAAARVSALSHGTAIRPLSQHQLPSLNEAVSPRQLKAKRHYLIHLPNIFS